MRDGDRLLTLGQIAEATLQPVKNLHQFRSQGRGPRLFKIGRRLVGWESDVHEWIDAQEAATGRGGLRDAA